MKAATFVQEFPVELAGKVDPQLYRRLEQIFHILQELREFQKSAPIVIQQTVKRQLQFLGVLREPLVGQETTDPQLTAAATVPGALTGFSAEDSPNVTITVTNGSSNPHIKVTLSDNPSFTTVDVTSGYKVGGTQVVGPQGVAIPDAVGGATIDAEARAAINAWLAQARTDGKIA